MYMNSSIVNHMMKEGREVHSLQLAIDRGDHHGRPMVNSGHEIDISSLPHGHMGCGYIMAT